MSSNPFKAASQSDRLAINRLGVRVRNLERSNPRPTAWAYATPFDPAPEPGDYVANGDDQPFLNGWQNIALPDGSWSPLRWRFNHAGRVEIAGAIDGGALGTVCVTLPSVYRPTQDVYATISSTDGSRVMTVQIATNGNVTIIGIPAASPGVGDGQVGTAQLVDGSVTTAKLADGAVTTVKIADGAVTSAKIADGTIETIDIADGAITGAKLEDDGVTAGVYGDATHVPQVTVDSKGRVTDVVDVAISSGGGGAPSGPAGGDLSGTYPNPGVAKVDGSPVVITSPAVADRLRFNGTEWVNSALIWRPMMALDPSGNYLPVTSGDGDCILVEA